MYHDECVGVIEKMRTGIRFAIVFDRRNFSMESTQLEMLGHMNWGNQHGHESRQRKLENQFDATICLDVT